VSQLAVKLHIAQQIALAEPRIQALTSFSTGIRVFHQEPDKLERLGNDKMAVVLGAAPWEEKRLSGAHGMGTKKLTYEVTGWVHGFASTWEDGGDEFDAALNLIAQTLRNSPIPGNGLYLTDPKTNEQSQLMALGEEMHFHPANPLSLRPGPNGRVRFYADLFIGALEYVDG
jgi:hypothetical protein